MSPIKKLPKRDDQLSSNGMTRGQRRRIAIDSRRCSIEIFDNEQAVNIKLQSKRIAMGCRIYYVTAATASRSDIYDVTD